MTFGSLVRKLIGKRRLTPVQLAKLIGPELLDPLRKATETLPVWNDVLGGANTGRIYFEIVAAQLFVFTDLFFRSCPDRDYSLQVYSWYGSYIAHTMSEESAFKFNYDELARRFKARGEEYLPILRKSPEGDYTEFAKLYCSSAGIADSYVDDQILWFEESARGYERMLSSIWDQVDPACENE
jgi:hypothetical protein